MAAPFMEIPHRSCVSSAQAVTDETTPPVLRDSTALVTTSTTDDLGSQEKDDAWCDLPAAQHSDSDGTNRATAESCDNQGVNNGEPLVSLELVAVEPVQDTAAPSGATASCMDSDDELHQDVNNGEPPVLLERVAVELVQDTETQCGATEYCMDSDDELLARLPDHRPEEDDGEGTDGGAPPPASPEPQKETTDNRGSDRKWYQDTWDNGT